MVGDKYLGRYVNVREPDVESPLLTIDDAFVRPLFLRPGVILPDGSATAEHSHALFAFNDWEYDRVNCEYSYYDWSSYAVGIYRVGMYTKCIDDAIVTVVRKLVAPESRRELEKDLAGGERVCVYADKSMVHLLPNMDGTETEYKVWKRVRETLLRIPDDMERLTNVMMIPVAAFQTSRQFPSEPIRNPDLPEIRVGKRTWAYMGTTESYCRGLDRNAFEFASRRDVFLCPEGMTYVSSKNIEDSAGRNTHVLWYNDGMLVIFHIAPLECADDIIEWTFRGFCIRVNPSKRSVEYALSDLPAELVARLDPEATRRSGVYKGTGEPRYRHVMEVSGRPAAAGKHRGYRVTRKAPDGAIVEVIRCVRDPAVAAVVARAARLDASLMARGAGLAWLERMVRDPRARAEWIASTEVVVEEID